MKSKNGPSPYKLNDPGSALRGPVLDHPCGFGSKKIPTKREYHSPYPIPQYSYPIPQYSYPIRASPRRTRGGPGSPGPRRGAVAGGRPASGGGGRGPGRGGRLWPPRGRGARRRGDRAPGRVLGLRARGTARGRAARHRIPRETERYQHERSQHLLQRHGLPRRADSAGRRPATCLSLRGAESGEGDPRGRARGPGSGRGDALLPPDRQGAGAPEHGAEEQGGVHELRRLARDSDRREARQRGRPQRRGSHPDPPDRLQVLEAADGPAPA